MMDAINCSRPHTVLYLFQNFEKEFCAPLCCALPKEVRDVLVLCRSLFVLSNMQEMSHYFLEFGYFSSEQMKMLRRGVLDLCLKLRVNAVGLVDCFNYADFILKAPLGCYDGDIYRKYFDVVKNGPDQGVPSYWNEIRELLNSKL